MAHHRTSSIETISSISSEEAVEIYRDPLLQQPITQNMTSIQPLEALVARARHIIENFASHEKRVYEFQENNINLDKILTAMLSHAEQAGGEHAERYVSSAIIASFDADKSFGKLVAVAVTWLTHLLYIFKASRGHASQSNVDPSPIPTPTIEKTRTMTMLDEGAGSQKTSFRDDVLLRDGYQCVITGFQDYSHPTPTTERPSAKLRACHILCRALTTYEDDPDSKGNASAAATLDILSNFTRLSEGSLQQLTSLIDDSSNGLMLQSDVHDAFDDFRWCLQETPVANEYQIKIYNASILPFLRAPKAITDPVVFVDQSDQFSSPANSSKRVRNISLPDAEFIGIHAAITGILNMSGAGIFFDELLDKYRDCGGSAPVPGWGDIQRVSEEWKIRQDIRASFSQIRVSS